MKTNTFKKYNWWSNSFWMKGQFISCIKYESTLRSVVYYVDTNIPFLTRVICVFATMADAVADKLKVFQLIKHRTFRDHFYASAVYNRD